MKNLKKFQISKEKQKNVTGGDASVGMGVCIINGERIPTPCDSKCPNGTRPFCFA